MSHSVRVDIGSIMAPRIGLSLRNRALGYLAQREHSRMELRRKLIGALKRAAQRQASNNAPKDANIDTDALADLEDDIDSLDPCSQEVDGGSASEVEVDTLLDALTAEGWLSQERYVDSRLRTRAPRLGARRLQAELAQHGLSADGAVWEQVQATEAERAAALLSRRFGDAPPPDDKERARRIRFLVNRGFTTELAVRLTRS